MTLRRPEVTNERRKFHELATAAGDAPVRLGFGPFVLDAESGRLTEGERAIPLAPKPFETLLYLAQRAGKVVTKAELIEALWPDTYVTEDVLVQSIVEVRKALGDTAKSPRYVQTLPRRGYQFLESVQTLPEPRPAEGHVVARFPIELARAGREQLPSPEAEAGRPSVWRRAALGVLVAGLLGVGLALMLRGRRPATTPEAPAAVPSGQSALLVMPIDVEEAEPQSGWLRQGLAEMIRSQLGQTPGLHVVARHRLSAALAEAGLGDAARLAPAKANQIARGLAAERLVTGSFVRVQARFVLSAQVVDVADGQGTGNASVRGRYPDDLLDAVDELCLKLVPFLGSDGPSAAGSFKPMRLATRSLDASRQYVEALSWFARGGRRGAEEAERRLDEAVRLDGAFAQAYLKKAEVQQWRRRWGYGDPDPAPAVQAAAGLLKDLPDRDQLLVKSYVALLLRHDPAEAVSMWRSMLKLYPTYSEEAGIPSLTAETLQLEGRWNDLILLGQAHVDAPSLPDGERARIGALLARAFRRKGEFEAALRYARRAVQLWPSQNGPELLRQRAHLGRILLETGRRDEALREFRSLAQAPEAEAININDAGWGLYMAGEAGEAQALVERALQLDAGYGNAYHLRGWLQLAAGRAAEAAQSFETAWEHTPRAFGEPHQGLVQGDLAALYYAGVAWQKAGQTPRARAAFEHLIAQCQAVEARASADKGAAPFWQAANFRARAQARLHRAIDEPVRLEGDDTTYYVQSARLHAVAGRREQALQELAQGLQLGHGEIRHVLDDPDFESLRQEAEFVRLTSDPGRRP